MDSKNSALHAEGYVRVPAGKEFWEMLEIMFTDEFMKTYTNFESFEYFRYSSAVMVNWGGAEMIYHKKVFDHFVCESTKFGTWDDMVMKAADLRFISQ